jgi:hypothetical protein
MPDLQDAAQIVGTRADRLGNILERIAALDEQPGVLQEQSLGVTPSLLRLWLDPAPTWTDTTAALASRPQSSTLSGEVTVQQRLRADGEPLLRLSRHHGGKPPEVARAEAHCVSDRTGAGQLWPHRRLRRHSR